MAWRCLALSRNFNQHCDIVNWTHVSKFLRNFNQEHNKFTKETAYEDYVWKISQYGSASIWLSGRSEQANYYRPFKENKVFVFRLKLHRHVSCWVRMTKHAHLVHVGPYKFVNMVRSRHIGAEYNAATLTYTRAIMQYFVQTLTDYLRFDSKIGMDANNLRSVLV